MAIKIDPETVTANKVEARDCALSFRTADARYHVWYNQETGKVTAGYGQKRPTLYKNSLHGSGHPEHFPTRYLDADNAANSKVVAELIRLAQPKIAEAQQQLIADKAAEREADRKEEMRVQALDNAIARMSQQGRDPTQEMLAAGNAIFHQGETPLNIWRSMFDASHLADDFAMVLDFAKRMRAEHNT